MRRSFARLSFLVLSAPSAASPPTCSSKEFDRSLRAAAERAASLYSPSQALAFIEHALTVTPDELERAELMERAGSAAEASANFPAAERYWTSAIETYQAHLDRTGEARAVAALGLELAL